MPIAELNSATAKRIAPVLAYIVAVAGICSFLVYGASLFIASVFELEDIDHRANAQHAFYVVGNLGIIVAFGLLALGH